MLVGTVPRPAPRRTPFGSCFSSGFLGESALVAQALLDLDGLGFRRVQLTEIAPGSLERLRPLLPLRKA